MIGAGDGESREQRKILTLGELPALRARYRDKRIVLCHGAFDLVHVGHLIHFEEARSLGDLLVVTVTADEFITKKRSVSFNEQHRLRQLAALEIVDYVALVNEPSAVAPDRSAPAGRLRQGAGIRPARARQEREHLSREGAGRAIRRPDSFHDDGRDVFLHQTRPFPAGRARGGAGQSPAAQRSHPLPRPRRPRVHARAVQGAAGGEPAGCASVSWARRSSTNGSTSRLPISRRSPAASPGSRWRGPSRLAARASSRSTSPTSCGKSTASRTGRRSSTRRTFASRRLASGIAHQDPVRRSGERLPAVRVEESGPDRRSGTTSVSILTTTTSSSLRTSATACWMRRR